MCCKRYHTIFSFKNHILVMCPATNLPILGKWCGFEKPNHYYFKIWPTNRFSKTKSYNFHFQKHDVTWPLSENGLLIANSFPRFSPIRPVPGNEVELIEFCTAVARRLKSFSHYDSWFSNEFTSTRQLNSTGSALLHGSGTAWIQSSCYCRAEPNS